MPYIEPEARKKLNKRVDSLSRGIDNKGELNYIITRLLHGYINKNGLCYSILSDAHGVCSDVAAELYRTVVVPYEISKAKSNGSIGILGEHEKSE